MALPRADEYNQAIQNPKYAFLDSDLKLSEVETTGTGLPKPYSGGFTTTYRLIGSQGSWAVRCFVREISSLKKRYQVISDFLQKSNSKFFVKAKYLDRGILVNGIGHPIIKMEWLEGELLNTYVTRIHSNRKQVEDLLSKFIILIKELNTLTIAHGDLQHGNIIIKDQNIFLIDYDGMYLDEISNLGTNEIGHPNYQHPSRSLSYYDKTIDRFSAIAIFVSLMAISLDNTILARYDNGDNLLFKANDFKDPYNSKLINELRSIPTLKDFITPFIHICSNDFDKIPSLEDFINGNYKYSATPILFNTAVSQLLQTKSSTIVSSAKSIQRVTTFLKPQSKRNTLVAVSLITSLIVIALLYLNANDKSSTTPSTSSINTVPKLIPNIRVSFNNVNSVNTILETNKFRFNSKKLKYLQPVLTFQERQFAHQELKFYYKIFKPNGELLQGRASPKDFTYFKTVKVQADSTDFPITNLGSIELCPLCDVGTYNFELWFDGKLINSSQFILQ